MEIVCERYEPRHLDGVLRFNRRMRAQGVESEYLLPEHIPDSTLSLRAGPIATEHIVAVDGDEIRGGYIGQWRDFQVAGKVLRAANLQTPISEGIVDKRYTAMGLVLLKHALQSNPYWYTVGMGGLDRPWPKLLKTFGWRLQLVPFWLRVHRANTFLREIRDLRRSASRRAVVQVLRLSGIGWLGVRGLEITAAIRTSRSRFKSDLVDRFGEWADELWMSIGPQFPFAGVRSAAVLNALYPPEDLRFRRCRVKVEGRSAGWVVLLRHALHDNRYFGDMRAGIIVDCLAAPRDFDSVLLAASRELDQMDVDFSFANPQHFAINEALGRAGYIRGPSNYGFGISKALAALLSPLEQTIPNAHLMRGDGDGLANFRAGT